MQHGRHQSTTLETGHQILPHNDSINVSSSRLLTRRHTIDPNVTHSDLLTRKQAPAETTTSIEAKYLSPPSKYAPSGSGTSPSSIVTSSSAAASSSSMMFLPSSKAPISSAIHSTPTTSSSIRSSSTTTSPNLTSFQTRRRRLRLQQYSSDSPSPSISPQPQPQSEKLFWSPHGHSRTLSLSINKSTSSSRHASPAPGSSLPPLSNSRSSSPASATLMGLTSSKSRFGPSSRSSSPSTKLMNVGSDLSSPVSSAYGGSRLSKNMVNHSIYDFAGANTNEAENMNHPSLSIHSAVSSKSSSATNSPAFYPNKSPQQPVNHFNHKLPTAPSASVNPGRRGSLTSITANSTTSSNNNSPHLLHTLQDGATITNHSSGSYRPSQLLSKLDQSLIPTAVGSASSSTNPSPYAPARKLSIDFQDFSLNSPQTKSGLQSPNSAGGGGNLSSNHALLEFHPSPKLPSIHLRSLQSPMRRMLPGTLSFSSLGLSSSSSSKSLSCTSTPTSPNGGSQLSLLGLGLVGRTLIQPSSHSSPKLPDSPLGGSSSNSTSHSTPMIPSASSSNYPSPRPPSIAHPRMAIITFPSGSTSPVPIPELLGLATPRPPPLIPVSPAPDQISTPVPEERPIPVTTNAVPPPTPAIRPIANRTRFLPPPISLPVGICAEDSTPITPDEEAMSVSPTCSSAFASKCGSLQSSPLLPANDASQPPLSPSAAPHPPMHQPFTLLQRHHSREIDFDRLKQKWIEREEDHVTVVQTEAEDESISVQSAQAAFEQDLLQAMYQAMDERTKLIEEERKVEKEGEVERVLQPPTITISPDPPVRTLILPAASTLDRSSSLSLSRTATPSVSLSDLNPGLEFILPDAPRASFSNYARTDHRTLDEEGGLASPGNPPDEDTAASSSNTATAAVAPVQTKHKYKPSSHQQQQLQPPSQTTASSGSSVRPSSSSSTRPTSALSINLTHRSQLRESFENGEPPMDEDEYYEEEEEDDAVDFWEAMDNGSMSLF